jgi:hypothetical protein
LIIRKREDHFILIPTTKAGDCIAGEAKSRANVHHLRIIDAHPHNHHLALQQIEHISKDGPNHAARQPTAIDACGSHLDNAFLGVVIMERRSADDLRAVEHADSGHEVSRESLLPQLARDPIANLFVAPEYDIQTAYPA